MLRRVLFAVGFAFGFAFGLSSLVFAACTPVTSLSLVAGAPPTHVSIADQLCNVITPTVPPAQANITWSLVNANGFFTVTRDATGFLFAGLQPVAVTSGITGIQSILQ